MYKELKFVSGAVGKKNFIPELQHFKIENRHVRSYNGVIALCSPINFDIDCIPKAEPFVKAINNCEENIVLGMTKANRLSVRSGVFKAFIDCLPMDKEAHVEPEGDMVIQIDGEKLVEGLSVVHKFIGRDAARPWSTGALLSNQSIYATNNVVFVEHWMGFSLPKPCNIPFQAVNEIIRIKDAPITAQMSDTSLTFHYPDGKWIRCQLLDNDWPDVVPLFANATGENKMELTDDLFAGVAAVKPFTDEFGRLHFYDGGVHTSRAKEEGASFDLTTTFEGVYQHEMISLLEGVATHADLTCYPKPCPFFGDKVRGLIIGMR